MNIETVTMTSFVFMFSLMWGSFLNVLAYRLAMGKLFFTKRSMCPHCAHTIAWYDNVPILSWLILEGSCRSCKKSISILYPIIELTSGLVFVLIYLKFIHHVHLNLHLIAYFIFFSALIAATRSDLEAMVIPQLFSIWLLPLGFLFSFLGFLQISFRSSLLGAFLGYSVLWATAFAFKTITNRDGMGIGDMELLAMIGSFLGPIGVWFSLLIASSSGILIATLYLFFTNKSRITRIPFGPFLAFGAMIYFLFDKSLTNLFF